MKLCKSCNTLKELVFFNKCNRSKSGINGTCKNCVSLIRKKYRQKCVENFDKNKEKLSLKICCVCKLSKLISEFRISKSSSDGHTYICKNCESIKGKQNRKPLTVEQKKQRSSYLKEYYNQNKEKIKENVRDYAKKNKEKIKEHRKEYRLLNKTTRNKKDRERRKNSPLFRLNERKKHFRNNRNQ